MIRDTFILNGVTWFTKAALLKSLSLSNERKFWRGKEEGTMIECHEDDGKKSNFNIKQRTLHMSQTVTRVYKF
jgi:hypothetical protein